MTKYKLLVKNARQVVQLRRNNVVKVCGKDMQKLDILEADGDDGISILVDSNGKIAYIGKDSEREQLYHDLTTDYVIDATDKSIIPGLVDAHTHPVWAGDRVHEFAMKLAGATYMDVHKAGGGIHYTMEHTRNATEDELYLGLQTRLKNMIKTGTTLVECKSGYGLNADTEIKMLKVIDRARRHETISISSTFCGAHAVPKDKTPEETMEDVINVQLPRIQQLMSKKEIQVDNIDVFCEQGVFNVEQSKKILTAGKQYGLQINFHGDELHPLNGAKMGAEIGALAISHLEEITDEGISAMVSSGSIGVVLPTTAYILRLSPPPVRKMIDTGMAVALGSDFNPNAFCLSMPIVMHLACVICRMSMSEALVAATLNSAAALGRSDLYGSLTTGKYADMVIIRASRWEHLIYQFGCSDSTIDYVIRHGEVVHSRSH